MVERINGRLAAAGKINGKLALLRQFLREPQQIGSIIPSSRFLERRILETAGVAQARTLVELGPGTGSTTRAILAAMPADGRLLSIEINPHLYEMVSGIDDPRLIAHHGSACDLSDILAQHGLPAPNAVISGIPFSTMPPDAAKALVLAISDALAPGGCFVAYQVRDSVARITNPLMTAEHAATELLNIPPARVYKWTAPRPAP